MKIIQIKGSSITDLSLSEPKELESILVMEMKGKRDKRRSNSSVLSDTMLQKLKETRMEEKEMLLLFKSFSCSKA